MSQDPTEDELKRMQVHESFFHEIESQNRWSMRLGKLQKRWDGKKDVYEQKRVDVLLSVDLVRHAAAGHIQHAVLIAGDSDFIPAVEAAKERGVVVSLWCNSGSSAHKELVALADEVHYFNWSKFPRKLSEEEETSTPSRNKNRRRRGPRRTPNSVAVVEAKPETPVIPQKGLAQTFKNGRGGKNVKLDECVCTQLFLLQFSHKVGSYLDRQVDLALRSCLEEACWQATGQWLSQQKLNQKQRSPR